MGTGGIVRRIDGLGRIVIPKEIRKTLNIKDGEMLEIIPDLDNKIVIRKYSMVKDIKNISFDIIKNMSKLISNVCIITDLSNIIEIENSNLLMFKLNKNDCISKELYNIIYSREVINSKNLNDIKLFENDKNIYYYKVIIPIILDTYVIGSIVLLSNDKDKSISESDINLAKFASFFISSSLD